MQCSLGPLWVKVSDEAKPFTWRDVLSTVNGLYDPQEFVLPVTIHGRSILRGLTVENIYSPLPQEMESWVPCLSPSPSVAAQKELCILSDASINATAAVAYLKVMDTDGNCYVGFVLSKQHSTKSATVLAVELADLILKARHPAQLHNVPHWQQSCPGMYSQRDQMILCLCEQLSNKYPEILLCRPVALYVYQYLYQSQSSRSCLTVCLCTPANAYQLVH